MSEREITLEVVIDLALQLSPVERARLIERMASTLTGELVATPAKKTPKRSLRGILAEFGPAPSAEDINEVRREMLANFPREDIA